MEQDDAADLAALQERVKASGGPDDANKKLAEEWVRFAEAERATLVFVDGGIYLDKPESASQKDAYSFFFKPRSRSSSSAPACCSQAT